MDIAGELYNKYADEISREDFGICLKRFFQVIRSLPSENPYRKNDA